MTTSTAPRTIRGAVKPRNMVTMLTRSQRRSRQHKATFVDAKLSGWKGRLKPWFGCMFLGRSDKVE